MILSANMLSLLSAQYAHEIKNALAYASMQSWAEMRGLDGTAAFFAGQSKGETDHANMVLAYIHARNEQLATGLPISWPTEFPASFVGQFLQAQAIERATTDAIYAIKAQAEAEGDYATCAWLSRPDGLILEQVEEENVIQTILDRVTARRGLVTLDQEDGGTVPAEMPGEVIHDIDAWLKARA